MEPLLKEKREVKEEQKRLESELRNLIEDLENKYEKQWIPGHKSNHQSLLSDNQNSSTSNLFDASHSHNTSQQNRTDNSIYKKERSDEVVCEFATQSNTTPISDSNSNPSFLRTFLDEDYQRSETDDKKRSGTNNKIGSTTESTRMSITSHEKQQKRQSLLGTENSTPECDSPSGVESQFDSYSNSNTASNDQSKKTQKSSMKNSTKAKSPWKPPRKDWVDDFTTSRSVSDTRESSTLSGLSDISGLTQRDGEVLSLPQLGKKKKLKKKENTLSYEPNLNVAQRSLMLKRRGSISKDYIEPKE